MSSGSCAARSTPSSKHTVITVTSALSLLIGASVGELSAGDASRHAALAACVAIMMGTIALAAWLFRAGTAVSFFSETVLVGFESGLALYLASTQLPKLFGFKGTHGDFWERSGYFITDVGETHETSLLVGVVALTALVAGKLSLKHRPVAFLVVIAGILAARFLDLEGHGVTLLGDVPQGLPWPGLPAVTRHDLHALLPIALAGVVLGAVETSASGRMFGQKHGHRFDANQELLALGAGNLLAGVGRGFPVSGGMETPERRPPSAIALWQQLGQVKVTSPWTAERAERWWREHLPAHAGPPPGGDTSGEWPIAAVPGGS